MLLGIIIGMASTLLFWLTVILGLKDNNKEHLVRQQEWSDKALNCMLRKNSILEQILKAIEARA